MKIFKLVLAVALTLTSAIASAENIYREGTKGHELATYAQTVLPDSVTPYFVMAKDKGYFLGQVDQVKRDKVLTATSQTVLQEKPISAFSKTIALTEYEKTIPEGNKRRVCKIVFVDESQAYIGSTLMHELMHCRVGSAELNEKYRSQFMRAIKLAEGIRPGTALSMFEEILTRGMSLSYIVNHGIKEDADFFQRQIKKPYPVNPGPRSMSRVLHLCIKEGACPIEAGDLAKKLLDDAEFRRLLALDFKANYEHDLKVGFIKK